MKRVQFFLTAFLATCVALAPLCSAAYLVSVVQRDDEPIFSFVRGTSGPFQQVFNPSYFPAGAQCASAGLLIRTQNCSASVGGQCAFCGGAQSKASVLTAAIELADGSFQALTAQSIVFGPHDASDAWGTEDPRIAYCAADGLYYLFYTAYNGSAVFLSLATTANPVLPDAWTRHGAVFPSFPGSKSAALLISTVASRPHLLFWGDSEIRVAASFNLTQWPLDGGSVFLSPRAESFDSLLVESGPLPLTLSTGDIIFFYNSASTGWPKTTGAGRLHRLRSCVLSV